jgi:hypothetical protein
VANTNLTPDLNAPRYRPKKLNLTNLEYYSKFIDENPKYRHISSDKFKEVITVFNGLIWKTVIAERDGVELPEQLGYLFIGTCPRKKSNVDFKKSREYGKVLQHLNWESDQYTAKIFYTNFETKYNFKNNEMWGFKGVRNFTRTVGQTYPQEWKKYVMVDNLVRVSKLFRKQKYKMIKRQEDARLIEEYDEFNLN